MISELGAALEKFLVALIALSSKNIPLICSLAEVLAKFFEVNSKFDKSIETCKYGSLIFYIHNSRKVIPLAANYQKRELWRCLARCNKNVAKPDVPNDDRESQAIYLLELIAYIYHYLFFCMQKWSRRHKVKSIE